MKILMISAVVCPLALVGVLPAAAGQTASPSGLSAFVQLAATSDFEAQKNAYVEKAQNEMREWQRKLHDFGEKAEVKGHEVSSTTKSELNEAWTKTEAESGKLKTATDDGWDNAKTAFERATQHLKDTWHKVSPEDD